MLAARLDDSELFMRFFNDTPIGMNMIASADGRLLKVNQSLCRMLGYSEDELMTLTMRPVTHPDDLEKNVELLHKAIYGELNSYRMEKRYIHKSGEIIWAVLNTTVVRDEQGNFDYLISQIIDITEQKNMEIRLQESEQRYKSLLTYSPVGICALNKDGHIFDANPTYEKITGYSLLELTQMHYHELNFPETIPSANSRVTASLRGEIIDTQRTCIRHKSGKRVEVSFTFCPMVVNGETIGIYTIVQDITEQMHNEELIRRSEQLSLVGELAAGIAHEIRNPLTSLRGFIQLFKSEDTTGSKRLRHDVMLTEIDRINEIVSELLVLAKPSNETIQLSSIVEKLEHVIMLFEGQANLFNIEINKDFDQYLPSIYSQDSLKQVFVNVLKNAIESMPKGGKVLIQAKSMVDKVCIRIMDQGCGIPQDKLDKIGQPFFTTKESGTGLGLMVCQRIIQNHKGVMRIESEVGKGTTVEVILPIAQRVET